MRILCDIGGTHARFALEPGAAVKYRAENFSALEEALGKFCSEKNLKPGGSLAVATAAFDDDGKWRFVNRNKWIMDPKALKKAGWEIEIILNDFAAATYGLLSLKENDLEILRKGETSSHPCCLIGPGTGLGLGFLIPPAHVQMTHGAQIPAAALSDEQRAAIYEIYKIKNDDTVVTYENVASGSGLQLLYRAFADNPKHKSPEEMLRHADDADVKKTLKLFHEFLGLAASTAVVTAHAYGGLYLTGALIRALRVNGLFDAEAFEEHFLLKSVESATRDLARTPVYIIKDENLALRGLLEALKQ